MIWVKVAALALNVAMWVLVWRYTRRINRSLAEIDRNLDLGARYYAKMTRPRTELTDKDEMLLRHLTRDPRQPFDGSMDDER